MERSRQAFSLHKRPAKRRPAYIYYAQFRSEDGRYGTAISTGKTNESAAKAWAQEYLKKNSSRMPSHRGLSFKEYAKTWWIWDSCEYIKRKLVRGSSISRGYADAMRTYLNRWVLPNFGRLRLSQINTKAIEDWLLHLHENTPLSPSTINHCLKCLRIMLREAERLGYINSDPTLRVSELREQPKEKTILSIEEVKDIFNEHNLKAVWDGDVRHFTLNLLAASTGMRLGECQGLQVQHAHPDHVAIIHAWARKQGLKEPKCNSSRLVPIPVKTSRFLTMTIDESPYHESEDLVFYGTHRERPIDHKAIAAHFYDALEHIGITPDERRTRNITFHSHRLFFNTLCRANKVPDAIVRRLTGHRTKRMTEHYTRFSLKDFKDVLAIQDTTFQGRL